MIGEQLLERLWYGAHPVAWMLLPLSWLFRALVALRTAAYRIGVLRTQRVAAPVLVVGNITVGGTGKTPLVIWLAEFLTSQGRRPGLVCRGYGGAGRSWPRLVGAASDPAEVGDEAVLLARRTGRPVAAGPDRVEAARALIARGDCDLVVSDDGLQHLGLARDLEIVVIDGDRRLGNGHCLPAGPLREPASRLGAADLIVVNGSAREGEHEMRLVADAAVKLGDASTRRPLASFAPGPVHAVCGIGHPRRFFAMLRAQGIDVIEHPFPDHHPFRAGELRLRPSHPVLMTEKDAVKCDRFGTRDAWYVPVRAEPCRTFQARLRESLVGIDAASGAVA